MFRSNSFVVCVGILVVAFGVLNVDGARGGGAYYGRDPDEEDLREAVRALMTASMTPNSYQYAFRRDQQQQQQQQQPQIPNFDYDGYLGEALGAARLAAAPAPVPQEPAAGQIDALLSEPKQFAYTPKDPRFYLPSASEADHFLATADDKTLQEYYQMVAEQQTALLRSSSTGRSTAPAAVERQDEEVSGIPEEQQTAPMGDYLEHNVLLANPSKYMKKKNLLDRGQPETDSVYMVAPESGPSHAQQAVHNVYPPGSVVSSVVDERSPTYNILWIGVVAGCTAAVVVGVVAAGICWIHERVKAAAEVDYPAYGVTGPSKDVSPTGGDRKLAQSAHMYHYQHQKQQMTAMQKSNLQADRQASAGSDIESEDENEDGDYTVYECPGLAGFSNSGEMEVKNPLYDDEPTPTPLTPHITATQHDEEAPAEASNK